MSYKLSLVGPPIGDGDREAWMKKAIASFAAQGMVVAGFQFGDEDVIPVVDDLHASDSTDMKGQAMTCPPPAQQATPAAAAAAPDAPTAAPTPAAVGSPVVSPIATIPAPAVANR